MKAIEHMIKELIMIFYSENREISWIYFAYSQKLQRKSLI